MNSRLGYLVGLFVGAHGLVYLATPLTSLSQTVFQGWGGSSAVLGAALGSDALKAVTTWLWILAGLGLVAAACAIAFASFIPGVWRPLAIGGALAGIMSFVVFWDGRAGQFVSQGGIGLGISVVVAAVVLAFPRAFP